MAGWPPRRRQHGVVAHRQLLAIGLTGRAVFERRRAGRLHDLHRGVYAVGTSPSRARAAGWPRSSPPAPAPCSATARRPRSGRCIQQSAGPIDVTAAERRRPRPGLRFHRTTLPPDEVTVRNGIPVTTVPRTLLDLAGRHRPRSPGARRARGRGAAPHRHALASRAHGQIPAPDGSRGPEEGHGRPAAGDQKRAGAPFSPPAGGPPPAAAEDEHSRERHGGGLRLAAAATHRRARRPRRARHRPRPSSATGSATACWCSPAGGWFASRGGSWPSGRATWRPRRGALLALPSST